MYANVRGIISKKHSIKNVIGVKNPEIIIFIETHLIGKATVKIEGYAQTIYRNRKDSGGGIMMAVKDNTDIDIIILKVEEKHEIIWVKIKIKEMNYVMAICYGYSSESRVGKEIIDEWWYELEKELSKYTEENVLIIGDLNAHIGNDENGIQNNHENINHNGEILRNLMERRELIIVNNTEKCTGMWTREDNNGSKSIIDYIITNELGIKNVEKMTIDEEHEFKVVRYMKSKKGNKEIPSDHNTIFLEILGKKTMKINKIKRWNFDSEKSMEKYRNETNKIVWKEQWKSKGDINQKYRRWTKQLKSVMYKTIDRITINNKVTNDIIKKEMERKRKINKEIKRLQGKGIHGILIEKLKKEIQQIVNTIIDEISKENSEKLKRRLKRFVNNRNSKANDIWKMRKRCMEKKEQKLAIKNENGEVITNKDDIFKEYERHFKQVLTNRTIKEGFEHYEKEINQQIETYKNIHEYEDDEINQPITEKEIRKVIKSLKRGKSPGMDEISNEIFINAGENLIKNLLNMFNYIWENEEIPDDLMKISIKTIYKGKGHTNDLNNHRGLFLSSCVFKFLEKIILNRVSPRLEKSFTEFQSGGRSGRGIRDQLFILRSIIELKIYKKEKIFLQFMDLSKAFDKMVLKNILRNLWNSNIKGKIWRIIFKINQYASLTINTPFGMTSEFSCHEILKQGSVLASTLAAMHVDYIHEFFKDENLGIYYSNIKIENLIFQDDIIRFEDNEDKLNKANIIFNIAQNINKMEFHPAKTKIMQIYGSEEQIKLGKNNLKYAKSMKYLGDIITRDGTIDEMIKERKNSIAGMTAELVAIMSQIKDETEFYAINQFIRGIIIPKLLINSETWNNIPKKNIEEIEKIQIQSIKRILKIPMSTPNMGLLIEMGMLTAENEIIKRRVLYLHSILTGKNKIVKEILQEQINIPGPTWIENTIKEMKKLEITTNFEEVENISKYKMKKLIKEKIWKKQTEEMKIYINNSSKCKKIEIGTNNPKKYLYELSPYDAKTLLLARLRMTDLKINFKNKYKNQKCRLCDKEIETLQHLTTCQKIPKEIKDEIYENEIYNIEDEIYCESTEKLKVIAKIIGKINNQLNVNDESEHVNRDERGMQDESSFELIKEGLRSDEKNESMEYLRKTLTHPIKIPKKPKPNSESGDSENCLDHHTSVS